MAAPSFAECPYCRKTVTSQAADEPAPGGLLCPFCGHRFQPAGPPRLASEAAFRGRAPAGCRYCQAALGPLEAVRGDVCGRPACQQQRLAAEAADRRNQQQAFRRKMDARARTLREQQSGLPEEAPVQLAIVPSNTREATPLPEERKAAFLDHLRSVIEAEQQSRDLPAEQLTTPYSVPAPVEPAPTAAQDQMLGLACAVCRGHCCRQGVEHAFQDTPSMRRIRADLPEQTPAQLVALYAEHFPAESYAESCVFHTPTGCNLPRGMRSDMCNTWICTGLHRWLEELPTEAPVLGYVVATPDYEPLAVRTALVGPPGGEEPLRFDLRDV